MEWKEIFAEIASNLSLKATSSESAYFGVVQDYPFLLSHEINSEVEHIRFIVHYQGSADEQMLRKEMQEAFVSNPDYPNDNLNIADGVLTYDFIRVLFRDRRETREFIEVLKQILLKLSSIGAAGRKSCQRCARNVEAPVFVGGLLFELCPLCLETFKQELENNERAYEQREINLYNVAIVGLIAAVLSAGINVGILFISGKVQSLMAILNGLIVGSAMYFVAKKQSNKVLAGAFGLSALSVILGVFFSCAYEFNKELAFQGMAFDLNLFWQYLPHKFLAGITDTAFALFCGLLGAFGAVKVANLFLSPPVYAVETLNNNENENKTKP